MTAHPGLGTAKPPCGYALARTECGRKKHECEAGDSKYESDETSAGWAFWRSQCIGNVRNQRHRENPRGNQHPLPLRGVKPHFNFQPCWIISWKNCRGSTRCAASCGHA